MNKANFFWQGNLSLYEYKCIESFYKNGFDVTVWSYQKLNLPAGVNLGNANEILPESELYSYYQLNFNKPSIAAFSDVFRFTLLFKRIGEWWFDTDCFCLKSSEEFNDLSRDRNLVAGLESKSPLYINGACLLFNDTKICDLYLNEMKYRCDLYKNKFPKWGLIGPNLITKVAFENRLENQICDVDVFYAIPYQKTDLFFNKNMINFSKELTKNSYVCHLWNEILVKKSIDKNKFPEPETFLNFLFTK